MVFDLQTTILICFVVFVAGVIDSIAGGGGLIALPAYAFTGMPIHMAYGTNKFSSSIGTIFSSIRYILNGNISYKVALIGGGGALVGSFLGAKAAVTLDETYLRYCLLVLIPIVAIFIIVNKRFGKENKAKQLTIKQLVFRSAISGLVIGAYDGFFGPGTGSLLILVLTAIIGLDITSSIGTGKIINLISNISALIAFLASGKVLFSIGIPAAICGVLGNWIGSGIAIKKGEKIVKPLLVGVLMLLSIKICLDIF